MMKIQFIMRREFKYILNIRFFACCMLVAGFISCNDQDPKPNGIKNQEAAKPDTVKAFLLTTDSAQKTISLPGGLLPKENAQIRAKVQGYIRKLNVDIGSRVKKGQV